jgi:mRNA interferase MazF
MRETDIILTPVPQADGQVKYRPALALGEMPRYHDLLVCGISTQLHQFVDGFDERIVATDADFAASGLVADSIIRLGSLAVVPRRRIVGAIESISSERHRRLLYTLSAYLTAQHEASR